MKPNSDALELSISTPNQEVRRRRGRPKSVDPDLVLKIAMNAYWLDDPQAISVNTICQRAGVSKPSLYRSFGSEDGLMSAALQHYATQVVSELIEILTAGDEFKDTLEALISFISDDPRMQSGCLLQKMSQCERKLGPKTRAVIQGLLTRAYGEYERFLALHQESALKPGISLALGARYLGEQIAFAASLRAAGVQSDYIRSLLTLSFSVFEGAPPLASCELSAQRTTQESERG